MIDTLRSRFRSMFTIMVGPQRITFMIGAGPQVQFIIAIMHTTRVASRMREMSKPGQAGVLV